MAMPLYYFAAALRHDAATMILPLPPIRHFRRCRYAAIFAAATICCYMPPLAACYLPPPLRYLLIFSLFTMITFRRYIG